MPIDFCENFTLKNALLLLAVCCLLTGCSNYETAVGQVPAASVSTESRGVFYPAVLDISAGQTFEMLWEEIGG